MKTLLVSAALLTDEKRRVLLARRPDGRHMSGLWEFPGGKVEEGESPEAALVRELEEELSIGVEAAELKPLTFVTHPYNHFRLLMLLYHCPHWRGTPEGSEGQALRWVTVAEMESLRMPPADAPLVAFLKQSFPRSL